MRWQEGSDQCFIAHNFRLKFEYEPIPSPKNLHVQPYFSSQEISMVRRKSDLFSGQSNRLIFCDFLWKILNINCNSSLSTYNPKFFFESFRISIKEMQVEYWFSLLVTSSWQTKNWNDEGKFCIRSDYHRIKSENRSNMIQNVPFRETLLDIINENC